MGTLYLLVILLPAVLGQCSVERATPLFSRAVFEVSVEVMKRIGEETNNHFVTSPLSLWTILSSISIGAEDETLSEIKQILHHHPHQCFNNRFFDIVGEISKTEDATTFERSSTVFIDKSMPVQEDFQRKLTSTGVCDIMILPFDNFVTVASTVNSHVSMATHDTVQEIIAPSDLEKVFLILIDAIYFKGQWQYQFDASETQSATFYDEAGNPAGDVNMMFRVSPFNVAAIDQIQAKVLELPYGNGDRFSMLIFLPYTDGSVATVLGRLDRISVKSIFYIFKRNVPDLVHVELPRFKISSDLDNLKELLMDMGLKRMFDSQAAQFPQISDYNLYVSNVVQKAVVEATEEGTVASAASEAEFASRTLPDLFIVNKPFFFMIVDKTSYIPLFTGAYSKPTSF